MTSNANPVAKAFFFPNILFVGLPMLMVTFIMGSVVMTGNSMSNVYPMVYAFTTFFIYGSYSYYTYHALDGDDTESIKDSGVIGIIFSLLAIMFKRVHHGHVNKYTDDMVLVASFFLLVGVIIYALVDGLSDNNQKNE